MKSACVGVLLIIELKNARWNIAKLVLYVISLTVRDHASLPYIIADYISVSCELYETDCSWTAYFRGMSWMYAYLGQVCYK